MSAQFGDGAVNGNGMAGGRPQFTDQQQHHLGYAMAPVNGMSRGPGDQAFADQAAARSWMAAPKQNPYLMHHPGAEGHGQQLSVDRPLEQVKPLVVPDHKYPVMPGHPASQPGVDWTTFQHGADNGYMNPVFPHSMATGQEPIHAPVDVDRKIYPATTAGGPENGMNGLYLASTTMGGDGKLTTSRDDSHEKP
jgi:hypothetical protein